MGGAVVYRVSNLERYVLVRLRVCGVSGVGSRVVEDSDGESGIIFCCTISVGAESNLPSGFEDRDGGRFVADERRAAGGIAQCKEECFVAFNQVVGEERDRDILKGLAVMKREYPGSSLVIS